MEYTRMLTSLNPTLRSAGLGLALALLLPACGSSAVMSGVAAGKVGSGLSVQAQNVPRGAEVCALQHAVAAPTGAPEKSMNETCAKALNSDELWRRGMIVLAAHAGRIEVLASGGEPETAGRLEAALTGVNGTNWVEVDGPQETAARDAVSQLVTQMSSSTSKGNLSEVIKQAAPQVKTLCDGLDSYFGKQVDSLADIQTEIEKKRSTRTDRRCASLDTRSICVSESVIDRLTYANVFGQLAEIDASHREARVSVATFCAVHRKLEGAVANGQISKDKTYLEVVDAVKAVPRPKARSSSAPSEATPAPKDAAPKK